MNDGHDNAKERMTRLALALLAAGVLAACASPAPPPVVQSPDLPASPPTPPPLPAPAPPPVAPPVAPPPASPQAQQQAQKFALGAVDLLEAGNEEQAKIELQRALALDGNNKLAKSLTVQLSADPLATLGRDFHRYTVQPGETLSKIAGRFLNDIYSFYILARYNDIKVPRQLAGGQVIKVPGRPPAPAAPPPSATAAPSPAPSAAPATAAVSPPPPAPESPAERAMRNAQAAERSGDLQAAMLEYRRAAALDHNGAAAKAEQARAQLVVRHTQAARTASVKQDLKGAIAGWDKVLELDPGNETAKLERGRAQKRLETLSGIK